MIFCPRDRLLGPPRPLISLIAFQKVRVEGLHLEARGSHVLFERCKRLERVPLLRKPNDVGQLVRFFV
jgi:hypothetical protein